MHNAHVSFLHCVYWYLVGRWHVRVWRKPTELELTERLNHPHYPRNHLLVCSLPLSLSPVHRVMLDCTGGCIRLRATHCHSLHSCTCTLHMHPTFLHMHPHSIEIGSPDLLYPWGDTFAPELTWGASTYLHDSTINYELLLFSVTTDL